MRRRLALVLFLSIAAFGCANPSAFRPAKTPGGRALRARLRAHPLLDPFFESTLLDLAAAGEVGYGPAPHRRIEAPDDDPFYALPFIAGLNLLPSLSVVGHVGPAQWDVAGWQYGGGIDLAFRSF